MRIEFYEKLLEKKEVVLQNGVINIQVAVYNDTHSVHIFRAK